MTTTPVSNERLATLVEDLAGESGTIPTSVTLLREMARELQSRRSSPSCESEVEWTPCTVSQLQRSIMDEDEEVRRRAGDEVASLYAASVGPYAEALHMVRDAIGEIFGPTASIESEEATLLRGPEPHHEAEAQIAALQRIRSALEPAEDELEGRVEIIEQSDTMDGGAALTMRQYDQEIVEVVYFPPVTRPASLEITDEMVERVAQELLAHGEFSTIAWRNHDNAIVAARAALTAALGGKE